MENVNSNDKYLSLKVASTLCWVLGVLNVLGGLSFLFAATQEVVPMKYPFRILVVGIALCIAGYGLRAKKKYAGYVAIIFGLIAFGSPPFIGFVIGLSIIILTIKNWKILT